jgi:flavin-dependent dehydrogenase
MIHVQVIGSGPAGSAAALTALQQGASVALFEKTRFPRHKVCGEFLSPEVEVLLRRLNAWEAFTAAVPALIRKVRLVLGKSEKHWILESPAFGLSRYALDALLQQCAVRNGANLFHQVAKPAGSPVVVAHGRHGRTPRSDRLFGFKAHFTGPIDDSVELFFFDRCYAGVSAVENGKTNVCGLAPESVLREVDFHPDPLLARCAAIAERIRPLQRTMEWLVTGPLEFTDELSPTRHQVYECGDALGFIDPFTGSGMLAALKTGTLAGAAAARGTSVENHRRDCWRALGWQYRAAKVARAGIQVGIAEYATKLMTGKMLFDLTRPKI